jgi:hypothetical protein
MRSATVNPGVYEQAASTAEPAPVSHGMSNELWPVVEPYIGRCPFLGDQLV